MNKYGRFETRTIPHHITDAMDRELAHEQPVEFYTARVVGGIGTERLKIAALDNLHHKAMYAPVKTIQVQS